MSIKKSLTLGIAASAGVATVLMAGAQAPATAATGSVTSAASVAVARAVKFSAGHVTDRRDGGRPVVLIAAALGVPTQVFRDAFSGVTPAALGVGPTHAEAQANKAALLKVLAPYGVTNERLDQVSNYYRYNGSAGEMWTHTNASARAVMRNGKVIRFVITNAGSGYSSAPVVRIVNRPNLKVKATLAFGTDLATNGRVVALTVV